MARRAAMQYVAAQKRLRALHSEGRSVAPRAMMTGSSSGPVRRGRGAYESARRDVRELRTWTPSLGSAASDSLPDLPELRARAYDLDRNAPIAAGITETNLDHVIGTGLFPVPTPDREVLGISKRQADQFVAQVKRVWWDVTDTTRLHWGDRLTGLQQQWGMLRGAIAGGDVFAVRRFRERPGDLLGLKIDWIEAPRVCNPNQQWDTEWLQDGLVFDEERRNTHIYVASHHPGERLFSVPITWAQLPVYGSETGERQILQVMEHRRFDQPRGVPLLAVIMRHLKQSDEGIANELAASVLQTLFTVFVKTQLGEDDEDNDLIQPLGNGNDGRHWGPPQDREALRLGRGSVVRLDPGDDVEMAATNRPNVNLTAFLGEVLAHAGAGVGMPPELMIKKFQTSYTAAMAAMQEAHRTFDRRQTWAVETCMQPWLSWIVDEAVLRGYIDAPGFHDDPIVRAAYLRCEWRGPRKAQLDELKAVLSAERRVAAGFSTIEHEATSLTGLDADQVHQSRVREVRRRVKAGLEASTTPALPASPTRPRDMMRPDTEEHSDEGGDDSDDEAPRRTREAPARDARSRVRAGRRPSMADRAADSLISEALRDAS